MIDKEMQRFIHLGIFKQDISLYSSPIMLIVRKNTNFKKNHHWLQALNSRLEEVNWAFPLMKDAFAILKVPVVNAY